MIYLLIGPDFCGKSKLASKLATDIGAVILSSDGIRRSLLNTSEDNRNSPAMTFASNQAFNILFTELDARTSYPINNKHIVIDTTGLSQNFRAKVLEIAKKNNYPVTAIIFDFKNRADYVQTHYLHNQIRKLKDELKFITAKDYKKRLFIKSPVEIDNFVVDTTSEDQYSGLDVNTELPVTVIGDIHGCADELESLLQQIPSHHIIIPVGDILDKGDNPKRCFDLLEDRGYYGIVGNHDLFFEHAVIKKKPLTLELDFIKEHFNHSLEYDDELVNKVQSYLDKSYRFITVNGRFIITHSPCQKKYLGKHDINSQKMQTKLRHSNPSVDFNFLFSEDGNYPVHIWGHVAQREVLKTKSSLGIDTGCAIGGKLTAVTIFPSGKYEVISVPSTKPLREEKFTKISRPEKQVEIDPVFYNRINNLIKNGVQFLSGTMSPSDKDFDKVELENVDQAMSYYKSHGVKTVCIQKKMMGSRAQVYLGKSIPEPFVITRSGYKNTPEAAKPELDRLQSMFPDNDLVILDCELLPWSVYGKDLIDKTFYGYYDVAAGEEQVAANYGYYQAIDKIANYLGDKADDFKSLNKEDFIVKHGHHIFKTHQLYKQLPLFLNIEDDLAGFLRQVDLYGGDYELKINPFSILKMDNEITILTMSNEDMWNKFNDSGQIVVDVDNVDAARKFFQSLTTEHGEEGVVVKPLYNSVDYVPYLKVRNPEYLRIIYGPSYKDSIDKFMRTKSINSKMRKSLMQWKLGVQMLQSNRPNPALFAKFLQEEVNNKGIDPRL